MNKALITHISDADGAFPIILSKLVFDNIDVISCDVNEVDDNLKEIIDNYDLIYIVDLNVSDEMAEYINNSDYKNKIKIYDHHESRLNLNKYPFEHVVVEQNGIKECGTTLYYNHLKELTHNPVLLKKSVVKIIELVRQNDTFDFTHELKDDSLKFNSLYNIYGRENYIKHFIEYIKNNDDFTFNGIELELVKIEEDRIKRYIDEKLKNVKKAKINNINVGIVFAESNRSSLGHAIVDTMEDVDIAVIINVDKSVSYRACKEEIDTNILAVPNGGGGHKHASGSPLPSDLKERIVEYIFKNVKWEEICK